MEYAKMNKGRGRLFAHAVARCERNPRIKNNVWIYVSVKRKRPRRQDAVLTN